MQLTKLSAKIHSLKIKTLKPPNIKITMSIIHSKVTRHTIKKDQTMPFAEIWMDLEIVILSEVRETEIYDIPYMQNLKRNDTNEIIYKIETDSQT